MDSVTHAVGRLIDTLEPSGETYALGGALALAAWAEPRATADVDVILWVDEPGLERVFALLETAGVSFDRTVARRDSRDTGMFVGHSGHVRVDVFLPSIPFYDEAAKRRVRTKVAGRETWIHSAEVLAVFKLLFFRPKDLLDLERMLEVQGARFDREFVRVELEKMMGDDPRTRAWQALCEKIPA